MDFSDNTFKNFYYPEAENHDESTDEEGTVGQKIKQVLAKKRNANSIDGFFERSKKKAKVPKRSSSVSQNKTDGMNYLSSGQDDGAYASHLIKIEVYDMDKIRNVPPSEHWKHCDVRVKYFTHNEEDTHVQSARDVIFNITKELSSKDNSVKYFIETAKK